MGTDHALLSKALFSKTLERVLGLLFGNPDRSFYANEIVRAAGVGVGTVQRELQGLTASGLVKVTRLGNQKHYQANRESPIFEELRGIATKALAPAMAVREPQAQYTVAANPGALTIPRRAVAGLCRRYGVAKLSLFGSAARGELTPESDIDLMVEFGPASKVTLWDLPKLQGEFSALFGGRRVELVPPEVMKNPFRRQAILADLRVLYEA